MHGTRTSGQKMRAPFYRLHSATLDPHTTVDRLAALLRDADAFPERHRLSEGAVYATACRRYLLDTGRSWKGEGTVAGATTWADSAHRYRYRDGDAQCSCGARSTVPEVDAPAWHAAHAPAAVTV